MDALGEKCKETQNNLVNTSDQGGGEASSFSNDNIEEEKVADNSLDNSLDDLSDDENICRSPAKSPVKKVSEQKSVSKEASFLPSDQDFQFKKILELGSGAGLLGLGILQLLPNIQSYTFTDISPQVLNILNANVNINDAVKKRGHFSTTDLTEWLVGGPPKIFIPENVTQINQSIQRNDPRQDIFIKHLDWSSVSSNELEVQNVKRRVVVEDW